MLVIASRIRGELLGPIASMTFRSKIRSARGREEQESKLAAQPWNVECKWQSMPAVSSRSHLPLQHAAIGEFPVSFPFTFSVLFGDNLSPRTVNRIVEEGGRTILFL
jgi:hypothetical protein